MGTLIAVGGVYSLLKRNVVDQRTVDFRYTYWRRLGDHLPTWWPGHPARIRREHIERWLPTEQLFTGVVLLVVGVFLLVHSLWQYLS
jgi:hypothetical protein